MACLGDNTLSELVDGVASPEVRARVESHIDQCVACRDLVAGVAGISRSVPAASERPPTRKSEPKSSRGPVGADTMDSIDKGFGSNPNETAPESRPLGRGEERPGWYAGMIVDGRYHLERKIGSGGMGTVWVAQDSKLMRSVAIKVIRHEHAASRRALDRFEQEAKAIARLRCPYIVEVYDYGFVYGTPYMVMELLARRRDAQRPSG
jgi:serine/threonine protein kinase